MTVALYFHLEAYKFVQEPDHAILLSVENPPSHWKRAVLWLGLLTLASLAHFIFFERHIIDEYFWPRIADGIISSVLMAPFCEPLRFPVCFEAIHSVIYAQSNFEPIVREIAWPIGYLIFLTHFVFFMIAKSRQTYLKLVAVLVALLFCGVIADYFSEKWASQYPCPICFTTKIEGQNS